MPSTWSEVLDALEREVARLGAAIRTGPREHEPMHDVVGDLGVDDAPSSPCPPELVGRASSLHQEMARLTGLLEQQMQLVHLRITDAPPTRDDTVPVFLDAHF